MPRFALAALAIIVLSAPAFAQDKGRKVAFLVGVGKFKHDLPDLNGSPQKDVAALGKELKDGGFTVVTLTDKDATKTAIEVKFRELVNGKDSLGKGDVLMVMICTHGFTLAPAPGKPEEPFVAAYESRTGEPNTMVSLNAFLDIPKKSGATCLYLIDACREQTDPNRGATRGIEPTLASLPNNTAILFACSRGELSHQNDKTGHGVFTFAVLKAIQTGDGEDWDSLVAGVKKTFRSREIQAMIPAGKVQTPTQANGEIPFTALLPARTEKKDDKTAVSPEPPKKKDELVVGGKAIVKLRDGADVIKVDATDKGGVKFGPSELDNGMEVTILDIKGMRCQVEWTMNETKYDGWIDLKHLSPKR